MKQSQLMRVVRAYAPEELVKYLDSIEQLESQRRSLRADIQGMERRIACKVATAELHNALPGPRSETRPITPPPRIPVELETAAPEEIRVSAPPLGWDVV